MEGGSRWVEKRETGQQCIASVAFEGRLERCGGGRCWGLGCGGGEEAAEPQLMMRDWQLLTSMGMYSAQVCSNRLTFW